MSSSSSRLDSLDVLRGFTIAAMVIVNSPGSEDYVYAPLEHAKWNGCTFTDLVFPFFLFIVGVSISLAYSKYIEINAPRKDLYKKIIFRAIKIYALGMLLWLYAILVGLFGHFGWDAIRWTGVLHRISIVFLICAFLYLKTNWKTQAWTGAALLIGYWILMAYIPVPGIGKPDLSGPMKNWAHYIDGIFLPGYMWQETWDPEGILSTLPAIATGISGMLVGRIILSIGDQYKKLTWLFFAGFCSYSLGELWNQFFPINKNLWTSSYVMYTSGLATMVLAAFILLNDMLGYKRWTRLGRIYGTNAITAYVISLVLGASLYPVTFGGHSLSSLFMDGFVTIGLAPKFVSFLYAIFYMLICYIPVWILYKKKIYIKL
jgi:predicted acyltransferase